LGASGQATTQVLLGRGTEVIGVDDSIPGAVHSASLELADLDLLVVSPGWPPDAPLVRRAHKARVEVISEVELAWRLRANREANWLTLTGTNGKTTTVLMLEAMLKADGRTAVAAGNVGNPLVSAVQEAAVTDFAIELSSSWFFHMCLHRPPNRYAHATFFGANPNPSAEISSNRMPPLRLQQGGVSISRKVYQCVPWHWQPGVPQLPWQWHAPQAGCRAQLSSQGLPACVVVVVVLMVAFVVSMAVVSVASSVVASVVASIVVATSVVISDVMSSSASLPQAAMPNARASISKIAASNVIFFIMFSFMMLCRSPRGNRAARCVMG